MNTLKGKVVLITGGANGIGYCTAELFTKADCKVIITDINEEAIERAVQKLGRIGGEITSYPVDVSNRKEVDEMAKDVLARFGRLDVLINNAGIGLQKELMDTSLSEWEKIVNVNLWGVLNNTYAFLPSMINARSGQIANVASGQVYLRMPTWGAYTATKMAVEGFSETLAHELKKYQIHVTTIVPYLIKTGFYDGMKAGTAAGDLVMKSLPYISVTPEKAGKRIFNAVKKRKFIDMGIGNRLALLGRSIPFYARINGTILGKILTKEEV